MSTDCEIMVPVTSLPVVRYYGQATYTESTPLSVSPSASCPQCGKPYHYESHPTAFSIEIDSYIGSVFDFISSGSIGMVVSYSAWVSMRDGGIKGLDDVVDIISIKKLPKSCQHARYVFINPPIGPWRIDYAASGVVMDGVLCQTCGGPYKSFERLLVEPDSFVSDAVDICIPQNMRTQLVCSSRFVQLVERKKLIGFAFVPGRTFNFDQFGSWG